MEQYSYKSLAGLNSKILKYQILIIKYIASKDKKEFMRDLKCVYRAVTEESAIQKLDILTEKWGDKYGIVTM